PFCPSTSDSACSSSACSSDFDLVRPPHLTSLDQVREAVRLQGQRLGGHEVVLHSMVDQMTQLALRVSKLTRTQASASSQSVEPVAPVPSVQPPDKPNIPPPNKYEGNPETCRNFFTQIQLIFEAQPRRFSNDSAKIAYVASLLEGPPLSYFNALLEKESPVAHSFSSLCAELKRVYDHPVRGQQAALQLMRLRAPSRQHLSCPSPTQPCSWWLRWMPRMWG
uniref:DUF4939 domain-containing protein n=1 Tax=Sphaeramia orbicularis TaxID=375764 RepID=A0A672YIH7_9TELE